MKQFLGTILLISVQMFSQGKGIEIYTLKNITNNNPQDDLSFNPTKETLSLPLFDSNDIENFDWEKQQFILTEKGKKKLHALNIPLKGIPVAFTLNGEPIYGFWLWSMESSFMYYCRVISYPESDFKLIFQSQGNLNPETDPRFDKRIKDYLQNKNEH